MTGETDLKIEIQGAIFNLHTHVSPNIRHSLVLGLPWLKKEECVVDLTQDVVYLGQQIRITAPLTHCAPREQPALINIGELHHDLTRGDLTRLLQLLKEHSVVFARDGQKLPRTRTVKHVINVATEKPFRLPPHRESETKQKEIDKQIKEMLASDVIERATSPYCSPIVLPKKKDGRYRFCVDYRRLNGITTDAAQPVPHIADALKDLGDASIFTSIDLKSGYWQIPMDPASKKYTAFSTASGGCYQFNVMPFGLKAATGTFQQLMSQEVLVGYLHVFCLVYLDDIIVYSRSLDDHFVHVAKVLERLRIHNLTAALEKCRFAVDRLEYLGHVITSKGNEAKPEHVQKIAEAPVPTTRKQLQSFLGTCNWLREYVPGYAEIAAPLTDLTTGKSGFRWNARAQQAFEKLKEELQKPLKLSRPHPGWPYILQTDASAKGMGAVLYQERPDGSRSIISYASAKFNPTESRYHSNEQECLAAVWAIKRYRHLLDNQPFTLRTDNKGLTWLRTFKDTRDKLRRWALLLQEFDPKIEHCPGKSNQLADFLSRNPADETTEGVDDYERLLPPKSAPVSSEKHLSINLIESTTPLIDEIQAAQQADQHCTKLAKKLLKNGAATQDEASKHKIENEILWIRDTEKSDWKILVPQALTPRILHEHHDSVYAGHPGSDETLRAVQQLYWWPRMRDDVRNHVRQCMLCACHKSRATSSGPMRPHQPTKPWDTIAVDLMGPYPLTAKKRRFIFVITDLFSRWTEAFALGSSDASRLTKILEEEVFSRWGYPRAILSDNGPQFTSKAWESACERWEAQLWTTAIYHPQANPTERRNQEIKKGLRVHLHGRRHKDWDTQLPKILYQLRNRRNAATGLTPAELLMGRVLSRPGDWRIPQAKNPPPTLQERTAAALASQGQYQQKYAKAQTPACGFKVGDLVHIRNHPLSKAAEGFHAGFAQKWEGPYRVTHQLSSDIFMVDKDGSPTKVYSKELQPFHGQQAADHTPSAPQTSLRPPDGHTSSATTPRRAHEDTQPFNAPTDGGQPITHSSARTDAQPEDIQEDAPLTDDQPKAPSTGTQEGATPSSSQETAAPRSSTEDDDESHPRYNLRQRKKVNYRV